MRLPVDVDGDSSAARRQGDGPGTLSRRRVVLDPPETVEMEGSAVSTAGTGGGGTSRLDFLRQTSATAALVGAVTSGLLLPNRPASAAFGNDVLTPEAEVAAAAAATEKMVWLNEDSGTVSSRLSEADDTYGPGFVAYLARFLLNFDEGCREYFKGKLDCALPKRDGSHIWEEFRVRRCRFMVFKSFSLTSIIKNLMYKYDWTIILCSRFLSRPPTECTHPRR